MKDTCCAVVILFIDDYPLILNAIILLYVTETCVANVSSFFEKEGV